MDLHDYINHLTDSDRNGRINAAESLGQAADIRSAPALCAGLADCDRGVRSAAAWALGRTLTKEIDAQLCLDDNTFAVVCTALRNRDNERYVRCVSASALGRTGDARAAAVLCTVLADIDRGLYASAADSLVQIGIASIVALCSALENGNPTMQIRAEITLKQICDGPTAVVQRIVCSTWTSVEQIVDTLLALQRGVRLMKSSHWMGYPYNLEQFCKGLIKRRDTTDSVRFAARSVLTELDRRSNPAVLLRASHRGDAAERWELLRGHTRDALSNDPEELVRAADDPVGG